MSDNNDYPLCPVCMEQHTDEMVECDVCKRWFHFQCVGVTEQISETEWICTACDSTIQKIMAKRIDAINNSVTPPEKNPCTDKSGHPTPPGDSHSANNDLNSIVNAIDEANRSSPSQVDDTQANQSDCAGDYCSGMSLNDKELLIEQLKEEMECRRKIQDDELEIECRRRSNELDLLFIKEKYAILHGQRKNINDCAILLHSTGTVKQSCAIKAPPTDDVGTKGSPKNEVDNVAKVPSILIKENEGALSVAVKDDVEPFVELSKKHKLARKVMGEDLPTFSGNVMEWPLFLMNFQDSTERGGYTNWENRKRLDKCLKPPARDLVKELLIFPENVPVIIENLKRVYERPHEIIDSMYTQIENLAPVSANNLEKLITFSIKIKNLCAMIKASGKTAHYENATFLRRITSKLPVDRISQWTAFCQSNSKPVDLLAMSTWLDEQAGLASVAIEISGITSKTSSAPYGNRKPDARDKNVIVKKSVNTHASTEEPTVDTKNTKIFKCKMCDKEGHQIYQCNDFLKLDYDQRISIVKKRRLCYCCLRFHPSTRCFKKQTCATDGCERKHHKLLHKDEKEKNDQAPDVPEEKDCLTHRARSSDILFKVLPVTLHGPNGTVKTYAFMDDGSSVTLLENSVAETLGLVGPVQSLCLTWTSDVNRVESTSKIVSVEISGHNGKKYRMNDVRTVQKLHLPKQTIQAAYFENMQHLRDIHVDCFEDAQPQILLGMDQLKLNTTLKVREEGKNEPSALKTRLGWVVCGPTTAVTEACVLFHRVKKCECQTSDENLHQLVKGYFALEADGIQLKTVESREEERARQIMEATTSKIEGEDRYETGLIWRYNNIKMPNSYTMAYRRLLCLESKMSREPDLAKNLCQQIEEYVANGYIRKLSKEEAQHVTPRTWILPIFVVRNVNKPNKTRIVWDAAAAIDGISLNAMLLKGPDLLCSLMGILFRFRQRPIAICGDIKQMFHRVKIRKEDQDSQRFLWREGDTSRQPDQYVMTVMTFGASCSPSSSQFVKNKNAEEYRQEYPRAAEAIVSNHYVDDLLDSVDTEAEAIQLAKEVHLIHSRGGFFIRNWLSNSKVVMEGLGEYQNDEAKNMDSPSSSDKILGMWWNTVTDSFCFKLNFARVDESILNGERKPTKRELLRTLMSMYDPLGLIAFLLVNVKVLLQDVWRSGTGWDEQISDTHYDRWLKWAKMLSEVTDVSIPRCYLKSKVVNETSIQLHLFCDASEDAYATVAYVRYSDPSSTNLALIGAKTKVAPINPISIPRMELQGAVLSARFSKSIIEGHTIVFDEIIYWCDSQVVLQWLRSDHKKYKQYVALRVGEICETTDVTQWRHVPTKLNVADDATKWLPSNTLSSNSRWFNGPHFLYNPPDCWPPDNTKGESDPTEELKTRYMLHHTGKVWEGVLPDPSRITHWKTLVRAQATVLRFVDVLKQKATNRREGRSTETHLCHPTPEEFQQAENLIFQHIQRQTYPDETLMLEKNPNAILPKKSPIRQYSPYLDEKGVLRHHGRIDAAYGVTEEAKRPIILPRKHIITHKIIHYYHETWKHANTETVINEIRQRFLIPKIRIALKEVKNHCQICKIQRAEPQPPQMGDLPKARLSPHTEPFTYTGIDLFGPMEVAVGRRLEKRWGVLFTCLNIRAVHVELVDSLETDALILSIRNFINRRGDPIEVFSDNGTNLHGADNEFKKVLECVPEKLKDRYERMRWSFIPPASPHMGGCWERLVQSIKKVLKTTLPTRRPTPALLQSMLIEAEAIVNARPLTHVSVDPDDPTAITPNHLLLRSSRGTKPIGEFTDKDSVLRKNWRRSQRFADVFWQRWVKEYLPTIISREKWLDKVAPVKIGDLVVLFDDNVRNSWQRGVVIGVQHGSNDQVRAVEVRTNKGIYTRPATKVAVLDVVGGKDPSVGTYEGEYRE